MNRRTRSHRTLYSLFSFLPALILLATLPSARANVYATNVKLNGGFNSIPFYPGDSLSISYTLNEDASRGVMIKILNGTNVLRTLTVPGNAVGARKGPNTVIWDGKDSNSNYLSTGSYSVSVTAATQGYTAWTALTDDANPWNYVYDGHGIAVDQNTNSPYYGRIFVANSSPGFDPNGTPGDAVGILKINADATAADEGISTTGDHAWSGNGLGPWKVEVGEDDFVYVSDAERSGEVYRWDPAFTTLSQAYVLRQDNVTNRYHLTGMSLFRNSGALQLWAADGTNQNSNGILKWNLGTNGLAATNDFGTTVVAVGATLNLFPTDVALDKAGNIYTCQFVTSQGDPNNRVFSFGGAPVTTARWAVGSANDNYGEASGLAVDPTGTYVAVAFGGVETVSGPINGNTAILYATNGAFVTSLDLGVAFDGEFSTEHQNTDCAWDAVGNVYYIDNWYGYWREFSPPGANQSTTLALAALIVPAPPAPQITSITVSGSSVTITFTASTNDAAGAFVILGSPNIVGPYSLISGVSLSQISPGVFQAVFQDNGANNFYRVARRSGLPTPSPTISSIQVSGQDLLLRFTGATTDGTSSFTVLAAPTVIGTYVAPGFQQIAQDGPGLFHALVHTNGPIQFYRIKRNP
jgi:hypothetical protein